MPHGERRECLVQEILAVALPVVAVVVVFRIELADADDQTVAAEVLLPVDFLQRDGLLAEAVGRAPERSDLTAQCRRGRSACTTRADSPLTK